MDELITIVIVAAAIIFKVVGKKLGSAGSDEVFPTLPVDPDMMNIPDAESESEDVQEPFFMPRPVYVEPVVDEMVVEEAERALPAKPAVQKPAAPVKPAQVKIQTPILEEEQPKQREKIDPKKLIIYSEIMKPKYKE